MSGWGVIAIIAAIIVVIVCFLFRESIRDWYEELLFHLLTRKRRLSLFRETPRQNRLRCLTQLVRERERLKVELVRRNDEFERVEQEIGILKVLLHDSSVDNAPSNVIRLAERRSRKDFPPVS